MNIKENNKNWNFSKISYFSRSILRLIFGVLNKPKKLCIHNYSNIVHLEYFF